MNAYEWFAAKTYAQLAPSVFSSISGFAVQQFCIFSFFLQAGENEKPRVTLLYCHKTSIGGGLQVQRLQHCQHHLHLSFQASHIWINSLMGGQFTQSCFLISKNKNNHLFTRSLVAPFPHLYRSIPSHPRWSFIGLTDQKCFNSLMWFLYDCMC